MLILTRKIDKIIVMSGGICLKVLKIKRDRVKIGIEAPPEVRVFRLELLENKEKRKSK